MPTTYEPIATTTLGAAAATITFSSIPTTYTDLSIIMTATGSSESLGQLRFNGDTASNYSSTYLYGNGTSALSSRRTSRAGIDFFEGSVSTTIPSLAIINIFSYTSTSVNKTCLITGSLDRNGSGEVENIVGLYRSTAAITSITLRGNGMNWASGTTATLYGIKNA